MSSSLSTLDLTSDNFLLQLTRELAMDIHDLGTVLRLQGITVHQFEHIKDQPRFQNYLHSALSEWNSAMNTGERIAVKAAASVELTLGEIHRAMNDPTIPLVQRVEALKVQARLGRVAGERNDVSMSNGAGFSVSITIGDSNVRFDTKQPEPATIEGVTT